MVEYDPVRPVCPSSSGEFNFIFIGVKWLGPPGLPRCLPSLELMPSGP